MDALWIILTVLSLWISFGLYVDSQTGPVRRAIMQRLASLALLTSAVLMLTYGV